VISKEFTIGDELYAREIGWQVLSYLRDEHPGEVAKEIEGDALRILEKIQKILDDESLEDPDCFQRIELIVKTFYANGISTNRHDWG